MVGIRKLGAGFVALSIVTATLPAGARERMTLKVSPAIAFAPANLIVRATVESDAENRAITIVAESDDFYRSSEIQLDGDRAPRTNTFEFRSLPSGTYHVKAALFGRDGEARATLRQEISVMASGGR